MQHLRPGEKIVYQTTLHPVVFRPVLFWAFYGVLMLMNGAKSQGSILLLSASLTWALIQSRYNNTVFGVTNKRVVVDLARRSFSPRRFLELLLVKIESIEVQIHSSSLFSRGTVIITSSGGNERSLKKYP
jgi:hypothetical protein